MVADHTRERSENTRQAEEAVQSAIEAEDMASIALDVALNRLFLCREFYPDPEWDNAYMAARDRWERRGKAREVLFDAYRDRERAAKG